MKKIVLFSLLAFTLFFLSIKVSAQTNTMMNSVFKIQAYRYNTLSNTYVLEQYGSAVLVANNILLTNAHVITDSDNWLTLQYEACQTISDQKPPKCFSALQLLKYDKTSDLALLQIVNPTSDMPTPVTIGSGTLSVGDTIRIIGYPANGGETITTTQWTIAGFENNYYKTDANVDEGNSWWWGFDNAWSFIGIPTFVVNGQTTLWYIIPTSIIQQFIAWDFGTLYRQKIPTTFTNRITSKYTLATQHIISNSLFTTPDLSWYWLSLSSEVEKKNNNLYQYILENANTNQIGIYSQVATDDATIQQDINEVVKYYKSIGASVQKSSKKIGTTTRQVVSSISDNQIIYRYYQTHSSNKTYLQFIVAVASDTKTDLIDMLNFVEAITVQKSYTKPQVLNLPNVTLSSKRGVGIVKSIDENGLNICVLPKSNGYHLDLYAEQATKWQTVQKLLAAYKDNLDTQGITYTTESSKYPSKVFFISTTDENDQVSITSVWQTKSNSSIFIHGNIVLYITTSKKDAITMMYKTLGLE